MHTLTVYPPGFSEPSGSPFCVKAMCLFQLSGLDWTPDFQNDPRKAPKAKFPVLHDAQNTIPDSDAIRDHLEACYDQDFDGGLSREQRATSRAIIRMVEENLYFCLVFDRWVNEANWSNIRKILFGHIPFPLFIFVTHQVRKQALAALKGQGMGRQSRGEVVARAGKDIAAVKVLLGDQAFLFGDRPTAADASVVPMLRAITASPTPTELQALVTTDEDLMAYLDRGQAAMYPACTNQKI